MLSIQKASVWIGIVLLFGIVSTAFLFRTKSRQNQNQKLKQQQQQQSLYDRLGGIYNIAAVVDRFSDRIIANPLVGVSSPNPQLAAWSRDAMQKLGGRLPGLKWMRTLWVADVTGGPYEFTSSGSNARACPFSGRNTTGDQHLNLQQAHCKVKISSDQFDAVAQELQITMNEFKIPTSLQSQILSAFNAHKQEVVQS
jgi:hemoglobin